MDWYSGLKSGEAERAAADIGIEDLDDYIRREILPHTTDDMGHLRIQTVLNEMFNQMHEREPYRVFESFSQQARDFYTKWNGAEMELKTGDDFVAFSAISCAGHAAMGEKLFQAVCDRVGGEDEFARLFDEDRGKLFNLMAECQKGNQQMEKKFFVEYQMRFNSDSMSADNDKDALSMGTIRDEPSCDGDVNVVVSNDVSKKLLLRALEKIATWIEAEIVDRENQGGRI